MLKLFLPNEQVRSVLEIQPERLKQKGIKAIITDLDNTLVAWDRPDATPELLIWFQKMREAGIKVLIVSNNNQKRVSTFSTPLDLPFIFEARKPMGRAFRKAIKLLSVRKEETVVIGDQLLTDVFGGNRSGIYTILVIPIAATDGFWTRINRKIERRLMTFFQRKGMIQWEERNQ
ncbi:YqeG family HAD IIIA-type phosphatase [Domibacillus sp. PGB-M46]|uniref:YqeG family HAD IIIA-type phosphatase n=1 Tax=Domibacillus sp. PGB-M46 TaxID=2910255 RepID=UPI001F58A23A|nr:YqeG family HAD IIIA-type phosphatase [Domibacillus sp. PGB-M46]MCI2254466.1 YqeG family HAD IIIA-type phosphatase [Domibacillus sp. PGB-M46]